MTAKKKKKEGNETNWGEVCVRLVVCPERKARKGLIRRLVPGGDRAHRLRSYGRRRAQGDGLTESVADSEQEGITSRA